MDELLRISLLGLRRAEADHPLTREGEAALLDRLARAAVEDRAAWVPPTLSDVDALALPEEEAYPWASPEAGRCLQALLGGRQPLILLEWLERCVAQQRHVPPRYLPRLLDLALIRPIPSALLFEATGPRGPWLARQNPQWQALLPPKATAWREGSAAQRRQYFFHLRQQDPAEARARLQQLRQEKAWGELKRHLPTLAIGLTAADLPLLDPLTEHRRAEVRQPALSLAGALPDSQLAKRAQAQASGVLSWEDAALRVHFPKAEDWHYLSEYQPLPWQQTETKVQGLGGRAQQLVRWLALIPPHQWERSLKRSPAQLLRLLPDHIWGEALFHGWLLATLQAQDTAWATQLLRLVLYPKHDPGQRGEAGYARWLPQALRPPLLALVPATERQRLLQAAMPYTEPGEAYPMAFWLMASLHEEVDPATTLAFAQQLSALLYRRGQTGQAALREFLPQLPQVATRLPVSSYPDLISLWAVNPAYPAWFDPFFQNALQVLGFRRRMHEAFAE